MKGCKFQTECPSASGWCISPKQDYEKCIPFLISAYKNAKKEIQDRFFTKIYYIPKEKDVILETEIVGFCKDIDGHSFIVAYAPDKIGFQALPWDKHIYFTEEEAQKHLKELKGAENV